MPAERPGLRVVVVAYGDPAHLRSCLGALQAPAGAVTVVDNGLSDVVEELAATHGADYLRPHANLGFAAGVNVALRQPEWPDDVDVLLLNPDAELSWESALSLQLVLRADEQCAAVAPLLVRPSGEDEPASWPLPSPASVWLDAVGLGRRWVGARFLTGAVLLLRAEALRAVGVLDERFFLYAEESDWQLRAQRAGWRVRVVDEVVAVHLGGATSTSATTRSSHFHRSARLFALKWYGRRGAAAMRAATAVGTARRSVAGSAAARTEAKAALRSAWRRPS